MRYSKRRLDSSANERCREEVIADQVLDGLCCHGPSSADIIRIGPLDSGFVIPIIVHPGADSFEPID